MNVILIITDTMRRDHLGLYGNEWIHTPNLDRLASQSCIFENAYAASFPTVPNRYDVMTGRFGFVEFDWSPLPPKAVVLSEVLGEAGFTTMMIADTPHILQRGYHFDRGFSGWEWIRGQENDRWRTSPADPELPAAPEKLRSPFATVKQHLRNTAGRRSEADCFCARTMTAACRWLEENADQDFFLYVDTFDPHEPWDPPQWYVDLYDPGYGGERVSYPVYGPADYLSEAELKHMRALYAGEVTLVDAWVGRLLSRVEQLGLMDNTAIIYTTDHGFYHGEHNLTGKAIIWEGGHADAPLYSEVARIPLLIRLPDGARAQPIQAEGPDADPGDAVGRLPFLPPNRGAGFQPAMPFGVAVRRSPIPHSPSPIPYRQRIEAYAQPPDLAPTILELMGVETPDTMQGMSLVPVMRGERGHTRPFAITTAGLAHDPTGGRPTTITEGEWSLIYSGSPDAPVMRHLTSAVDSVDRPAAVVTDTVPPPELYHLPTDPAQRYNVYQESRDIAVKLHADHVRFLEALGLPEQHLRHRREL